MEWKVNARKRSSTLAKLREAVGDSVVSMDANPIRLVHGKPVVTVAHTRDFVDEDDEGGRAVVASIDFRKGDYIFPKAYLHPTKRIVGETKDARFDPVRGWIVYLDAVLRDGSGHPVIVEGCEVDQSGWFLESELQDAKLGMEPIRIGAMRPSAKEIEQSTVDRIRRRKLLTRA